MRNLNFFSVNTATFVLFRLKDAEHLLNLYVCFQFCAGLCIFESHLLIYLEKVGKYHGIHAFALIVWPYTDKQQVKSIRFANVHVLYKLPPTGREELSTAFL